MTEMRRQIGIGVCYASYYFIPTGLAFLGVLLDRWIAWMPSFVILFYVTCAFRAHNGKPAGLLFAGEQVYFLGYLCTIVAFLALAFRLRNGIAPEDLRAAVMLVGCVALSTTIAGLFGMAVLREVARCNGGFGDGDAQEVVVTVDLPAEATSSLDGLRQAAEKTRQAVEELGKRLQETGHSASGLGKALVEGESGTRSFAKETNHSRQTLGDYASLVEQKLALEKASCSTLVKLRDAYSAAGTIVAELEKLFLEFNATLQSSNSKLVRGNAALAVFAEAAPQIQVALEDYVILLDKKLEEKI